MHRDIPKRTAATAAVRFGSCAKNREAPQLPVGAGLDGCEAAADAFCYAEGPAALLVGPEGGFDDAERAAIRAHPASVAISLGPRILRGETAAIAGISVWMAEAGDWLGEE